MSLKPYHGRSFKRLRRIEIAAILEGKFVPDQQIANHLGITVAALQVIKNTPEYLAARIRESTGVLSVYQEARLQSEEAQKEELAGMIPMALTATKRILTNPDHPHHAKVVLDLLDRSKSTSKISRTEHSVDFKPDTSAEDRRATKLLGILQATTVEEATNFDDFRTPSQTQVKTEDKFGALDGSAARTMPYTPKSYNPEIEASDPDSEEGQVIEGTIN